MIAALTGHELNVVVFILGVGVLLGAAWVAYTGRWPAAGMVAVIGVILLLLAS